VRSQTAQVHVSLVWIANGVIAGSLTLAAWRWGAAPERWCAASLLFMVIADRVYHLIADRGTIYLSVDVGHLAIDLTAAAILIGVALWANRIYPLWLAAFQSLAVLAHFTREASTSVAAMAYAILSYAPTVFLIVILASAIWLHTRRIRRHGPYRDWRPPPSRKQCRNGPVRQLG
jgi:hypothetical protein